MVVGPRETESGWSNKSAIGLAMKKTKRVEEKFRGRCGAMKKIMMKYSLPALNRAARKVNELFEKARETHDPRAITHLLMKYPYTRSPCWQLATHMVVGDADKGSDAIEQCLAALEKSFPKISLRRRKGRGFYPSAMPSIH